MELFDKEVPLTVLIDEENGVKKRYVLCGLKYSRENKKATLSITANAIRAGVTETPALLKIPSHKEMIKLAQEHNPSGRLTQPIDVAKAILALSSE